MITIRKAQPDDLDFIIYADLESDGWQPAGEAEKTDHHAKMANFVSGGSDAGWIAEDSETCLQVGVIMTRFRDRLTEPDTEANRFLFRYLHESIFPQSGRFCEIYQLWVSPPYRRQGIATQLKQRVEAEALKLGLDMVYTHTESKNTHVVELNQKLGYEVVRVGPIWDDVPRTSLVKRLSK